MEFDFRCCSAAELRSTLLRGRDDDSGRLETFTFTTGHVWQHAVCYLGTNSPGFSGAHRARRDYSNAGVELDTGGVGDEPTDTNTLWRRTT
jgi:hypothetical protein